MTLQIGEMVGAYRVIAQLGQGGMATVYKAYHAGLDRYVAIKVLHPAFKEDNTFLARFQREARVLAKLEHPNIVPIYDFAEHDGQPYLVMKYIEGETLKSRLSSGPVSLAETIKVVDAVGSALAYAHKQGVLHRDIKPSNVIITHNGFYYLSDFGLARIASAGESTLSQDTMLGTPSYISPEQAKGVRDLDGRTDIYSFGVVLYEMLVGRVPFSGDTPFAVIHDHIYTPLPPPTAVNPNVTPALEMFLLKALAKERADRFPDVSAMTTAFHQALESQPPVVIPAQARIQADAAVPAQSLPSKKETRGKGKPGAATVLAPPPAPTVLAQKDSAAETAVEGKPAVKPADKKRKWIWIAGAVGLGLCLCFSCLLAGRAINNAQRTQTAVALTAQPTQPQPLTPPVAVGTPAGGPPPCNQNTEAIKEAQAAAAAAPKQVDPQLALAEAYRAANCGEQALGSYFKAAELSNYTPELYKERIIPALREDPIMALTVVADGLQRRPQRRELWEIASPLMLRVAELDGGEGVLTRMAREFPNNPLPSVMLAQHYLNFDRLPQAEPIVNELRRKFPDELGTHFVSARYRAATGDIEGALREFELVANDPTAPPYIRQEAQNYIKNLKGTPKP